MGMVIGEHSRGNDLEVNVLKGKQLTNIRAAGKDEAVRLTPPRKMSLEQAIAYIEEDELVEITPKSIRLRKRFLNAEDRKRAKKQAAAAAEEGKKRNKRLKMSGRNVDFGDRLAAAAAAKQALLEKARAKANDPELARKQAERAAIAAAREAREAERRAAKKAEEDRIAAEADRIAAEREAGEPPPQAAVAAAEAAHDWSGKPSALPSLVLSEAEQKAARDARYAARKARKSKKR